MVFVVWNMRFAHVPHHKHVFRAASPREHPAREGEDSEKQTLADKNATNWKTLPYIRRMLIRSCHL
jgi:hypothetical protein